MANFHRVNTSDLIRGAARLLIADALTMAKPTKLADVIELTTAGQTNEVQTVTLTANGSGGTGTAALGTGTFTVTFRGATSAPITYSAVPATLQTSIQAALDALGTIGTGNSVVGLPVNATGSTAFSVTFGNTLGYQNLAAITGSSTIAVTGYTGGTVSSSVSTVETTPGKGLYDPKPGWADLGGTRDGIQISVNNSEDSFDIDQIAGDIGSAPTAWEVSVATRLAEMTLEKLQIVWEGSAITTDTTTTVPEKEVGFAGATSYTQRRLAVLFQKPNGKIRGYLFHKVQRAPQEATIDHRKGGEAMSIPMSFKALADETISDPKKQFFIIRDQAD